MEAIKKEIETDDKNRNSNYYVYKRWLDTEGHFSVEVKPDGELVSICDWSGLYVSKKIMGETDADLFTTFYDLDFYIPVSFRKGDILADRCGRPFVLVRNQWRYMTENSSEDRLLKVGSSDDSIDSCTMCESGCVFWDCGPSSIDLEYYRGELTGLNRVLIAISNHIKGEISVDLMMNAYDIILHEEQCNNLHGDMWYTNDGLALAGLDTGSGV